MFNIGTTEILLIAAVALIILGPEKFPGHAKIALRFMRDIRNYWDDAKRDLANEIKPLKKELKELEKYKAEDYLDAMGAGEEDTSTSPYGEGYPYEGEVSGSTNKPTPEPAPQGRSEDTAWEQKDAAEESPIGTANATPRDYSQPASD